MKLLSFFLITLLGFVLISPISSNNFLTFVYGENEVTVEGYLNILHTHTKDGTFYEYHLFDFDTFSKPIIILEFSNKIPLEEVFKLSGTKVVVKGTFTGNFFNPDYQTMNVSFIKPSGATIELDQKVYTWTDKVFITIVAPSFNLDSTLVDTIGNNPSNPVVISSRGSDLYNYKLVESDVDSGIFNGEITLTGFLHDADGNPATGDGHGFDTKPKTLGIGPIDGFLESDNEDGITVSFEFSKDETVVGSALIRWNIGEVQWLEASYPTTGTGVVRVIDPDMNLDPEVLDNLDINVWSKTEPAGIDLIVTETKPSSGIFEGEVFFNEIDLSGGNHLTVHGRDTVTAEYKDNTLPDPYTTADELDISAVTHIQGNVNFFEKPSSNKNNHLIEISTQEFTELPPIHKMFHHGLPHSEDIIIENEDQLDPQSLGAPREFTALVIPIKFEDLSSESKDINYLQQIISSSSDSVSSFWEANSYGKFHFKGTVLDWSGFPNLKEFYVQDDGSLRQWAIWDDFSEQFAPQINFDGFDGIKQNTDPDNLRGDGDKGDDIDQIIFIVTQDTSEKRPILNPSASSYQSPFKIRTNSGYHWAYPIFIVDGGLDFPIGPNYQNGYGALAHEMGHNFVWDHTPMMRPHDTYSDPWSLMSGINDKKAPPGVVAFLKKKAHWIDSEDTIKVEPGQSKLINLTYLSSNSFPNEYHIAEIPFGTDQNFYTLEARKENKFDHIPTQTGLLIYQFNPEGFGEDIRSETERKNPLSVVQANEITCYQENENGICVKANYEELSVKPEQIFVDS